jgi:hypothetical protein
VPKTLRGRELPRDGERVLFCQHAKVSDEEILMEAPVHWWWVGLKDGSPNEVTQNDGQVLRIRWLVLCEKCQTECKGRPDSFARQDAEWIGEQVEADPIQ